MFATTENSRQFSANIKNLIRQSQNDRVIACAGNTALKDLSDSSNTSLLHLAAKYNNCDLVKHLIKRDCKVNVTNDSQMTPLMVAAASNSFKAAQILIESDANIYATNSSGTSALELLLKNKRIPQYLINCCFKKVKSENSSDFTIAENLFIANCPFNLVVHLKNASVTRLIMERYGQLDPQQSQDAMDLALKLYDKENIEVLLQFGIEVDISNEVAVKFLGDFTREPDNQVNLQLMNAFLERVTDWNCLDGDSLYLIDSIFREATRQQIDLFLRHNINDCAKNKFPGHDLIVNLFRNNHADVRELLKHQIFDVNSHGQDGSTALHFAVEKCDLASVRMLLELGANPNIENDDRRVPLFHLATSPYPYYNDNVIKMSELFFQAGADPQLLMDDDDEFSLWYEYYHLHMLEILLAQLAIHVSMGTRIRGTIYQSIIRILEVKAIYERCTQELEKLKEMKVQGSTTLYTMLVTDTAKLVNSIRDGEALQAIGNSVKQFHFYYSSKLKDSANRILHTIDLRHKGSAFICETTNWPNSQYIVIEKILSFLTYKDLLVFDSLFSV